MVVAVSISGQAEPAYEIAQLYPCQGQWSEADYFALPDRNRYVELTEGRIIVPPHPTSGHQRLVLRIARQVQEFVEKRSLGEVFIAPVPVRLWPGKIREPDVFFIAREHADRIGEQFCGVPDLVVEVISPGTRKIDREEKFAEYARAGVREYWLVEPDEKHTEVYSLQGGGWVLAGRYPAGEAVTSGVLPGLKAIVLS